MDVGLKAKLLTFCCNDEPWNFMLSSVQRATFPMGKKVMGIGYYGMNLENGMVAGVTTPRNSIHSQLVK